jgi:hypothetical protein
MDLIVQTLEPYSFDLVFPSSWPNTFFFRQLIEVGGARPCERCKLECGCLGTCVGGVRQPGLCRERARLLACEVLAAGACDSRALCVNRRERVVVLHGALGACGVVFDAS